MQQEEARRTQEHARDFSARAADKEAVNAAARKAEVEAELDPFYDPFYEEDRSPSNRLLSCFIGTFVNLEAKEEIVRLLSLPNDATANLPPRREGDPRVLHVRECGLLPRVLARGGAQGDVDYTRVRRHLCRHRTAQVMEEVESGADGDGNAEKLSATLDVALGALKQKSAEDTVDINTYANRVKGLSR